MLTLFWLPSPPLLGQIDYQLINMGAKNESSAMPAIVF